MIISKVNLCMKYSVRTFTTRYFSTSPFIENTSELGNHLNNLDGDDLFVLNYHITDRCMFNCNWCYSTWDREKMLDSIEDDLEQQKELFRLLNDYVDLPLRVNFTGGEPLLVKSIYELIDYMIEKLDFKVSLITNGYLLDDDMIDNIGTKLHAIGFSIDSLSEETNAQCGRSTRWESTVTFEEYCEKIEKLRTVNPEIKIKINTVVGKHNIDEDMSRIIETIEPDKWSVVQLLPVFGNEYHVNESQFDKFVSRHESMSPSHRALMSSETNENYVDGFLMITPDGRFFSNGDCLSNGGIYKYSKKIIEVGVEEALSSIEFSLEKYFDRHETMGEMAKELYYEKSLQTV